MGIECIICQCKIHPRDNDAFATQCGHIFHKLCIYKYLFTNNSCPCCKSFCSIQQLFQLFTNLNDGDEEEEKCNIQSQNELLLQRISLLNKQIRIRDKKFGDLSKIIDDISENIDGFESMNEELEAENCMLEESIEKIRDAYRGPLEFFK